MIVTRLKLPLDENELIALQKIADDELRSPTDQVRVILRQELSRLGLLTTKHSTQENENKYSKGIKDETK